MRTTQEEGWSGIENGELLRRAAVGLFDAFVTVDKHIEHREQIPPAELSLASSSTKSCLCRR